MLSDVVTLAALVQQAPALVLAALALLFAGWTFRQARRADAALEARLAVSAVRQGKRLGAIEHTVGLLDMRRRITEEELAEDGVRLSYWPPDGRRPSPGDRDRDDRDDRDDQAAEDDPGPLTEARRIPIPPLPPAAAEAAARHRRNSDRDQLADY